MTKNQEDEIETSGILREIRVDIRLQSECNSKFAIDNKSDERDKEAISKAFDTQRLFISPVMCATVPLNKHTGTCR